MNALTVEQPLCRREDPVGPLSRFARSDVDNPERCA